MEGTEKYRLFFEKKSGGVLEITEGSLSWGYLKNDQIQVRRCLGATNEAGVNWETRKVFSSSLWGPLYFIWFPGAGEKNQSSLLPLSPQNAAR